MEDAQNGQRQICLVSDQNAAEILGALAPYNPAAQLHAIVTSQMKKKGEHLKRACEKNGVICSLHELPAISINAIESLLDEIWLLNPDAHWAINITGGTKIMVLAAYAWAVKNHYPAFYIDTAAKLFLTYEDETWSGRPLPDLLDWETLVVLNGFSISQKIKSPVAAMFAARPKKCCSLLLTGEVFPPFTRSTKGLEQLERRLNSRRLTDIPASYANCLNISGKLENWILRMTI